MVPQARTPSTPLEAREANPQPALQAQGSPSKPVVNRRSWRWGGLLALAALLAGSMGFRFRRFRRSNRPRSGDATIPFGGRAPSLATALGEPEGLDCEWVSGLSFGPYLARRVLGRGGCATA